MNFPGRLNSQCARFYRFAVRAGRRSPARQSGQVRHPIKRPCQMDCLARLHVVASASTDHETKSEMDRAPARQARQDARYGTRAIAWRGQNFGGIEEDATRHTVVPAYSTVRWTSKLRKKLGKVPDIQIAKLLGVSGQSVKKERLRQGIPQHRIIPGTPRMIALLGTMPDVKLVEPFGISQFSLMAKRRELGIPPYRKAAMNALHRRGRVRRRLDPQGRGQPHRRPAR
jgi:hypothetical protein